MLTNSFKHDTPCRNGEYCDRFGCRYSHNKLDNASIPCKFGFKCTKRRTCKYSHPVSKSNKINVTSTNWRKDKIETIPLNSRRNSYNVVHDRINIVESNYSDSILPNYDLSNEDCAMMDEIDTYLDNLIEPEIFENDSDNEFVVDNNEFFLIYEPDAKYYN